MVTENIFIYNQDFRLKNTPNDIFSKSAEKARDDLWSIYDFFKKRKEHFPQYAKEIGEIMDLLNKVRVNFVKLDNKIM